MRYFLQTCLLIKTRFCPCLTLKRLVSSNIFEILNTESVKQFLSVIGTQQDKLALNNTISQLVKKREAIEKELSALSNLVEDDGEMLKLIKEENDELALSVQTINKQILLELLPNSEVDRDVIVEVSAGVGGKEAMHFASELFEMYSRYCLFKNWNWELQEVDTPESGGIRHGSAFVCGRGAASYLLQESGVHRVQRVPATEKSGRIHTSTVTVAILPQPTDIEVVIKDKDLKIDTKTSSGAGGQHVNKTESCVRITHIPTGIVIENQTDRSQIKNKKLALQRLRSKLYQMQLDGFQNKTHSSRKEQVGSSMRSEKIRTYNYNQDRVSDHRIGATLHDLPRFLAGGNELDQLIVQLVQYDRKQQLLRLIEEMMRNTSLNSKPGEIIKL